MSAAKRRHLTIAAGPDPADAWRSRLTTTRDGGVAANAANALAIIRHDPEIHGRIRYNVLTAQVEVVARLPGDIDAGTGAVSDVHIHALTAYVGESYGMHARPGMLADAVSLAAREHMHDPVREYLDGLAWDGTPRVASYAASYLGCDATAYAERVSAILFIGVVARSYAPGCKFDSIVVLEGAQGCGKTTAVRELIHPEWCVEVTESFGGAELPRQIRGAVVGELGELSSLSRADYSRAKQFATQQADMVRDPYARFPVSHPRRCVFVGTTNQDDWNRDPTGARRFLPLRVSGFRRDEYLRDRDQMWAEAVHLHRAGADYWSLPATAADEQAERYDHDPWTDPIAHWLAGKCPDQQYPIEVDRLPIDKGCGVRSTKSSEILRLALGVDTGRHERAGWLRVSAIMLQLGWTRARTCIDGVRAVRYTRPNNQEAPDAVPF